MSMICNKCGNTFKIGGIRECCHDAVIRDNDYYKRLYKSALAELEEVHEYWRLLICGGEEGDECPFDDGPSQDCYMTERCWDYYIRKFTPKDSVSSQEDKREVIPSRIGTFIDDKFQETMRAIIVNASVNFEKVTTEITEAIKRILKEHGKL